MLAGLAAHCARSVHGKCRMGKAKRAHAVVATYSAWARRWRAFAHPTELRNFSRGAVMPDGLPLKDTDHVLKKLQWMRRESIWPNGLRYLWTDAFGVVLMI